MNDILDSLRLLVLHIGRRHCGTEWNFSDVCSPFTRIYYITSGEAEVLMPDRVMPLRAGHMYVIPAFTTHGCRCRGEFVHYYVHLYNESARYVLEDWDLPGEISAGADDLRNIERLLELCPGMELMQTDTRTYGDTRSIADRIDLNKSRHLWARMESRGLIYLLLSRFIREAVPKTYTNDERIREVLGIIRADITSDNLGLDTLAAAVGLSKDHLIRLFRRELDTTPARYIATRRIEAAQLRLVTETKSVKEIAFDLGFDDLAYFCRLFKKHTGMTPLTYRNQTLKV